MIKLKDWFLKLYFVFFAILLIDVISYYDKRVTVVFFSALSVAIAAFIGRFFADKINRLSGRFIFLFSVFVILLMTVGLVLIGFYMISDPKTDWGVVYQSMQDIISKGHVRTVAVKGDEFSWFAAKSYNDYFVIYNNNYFYLCFLTVYYKIVTSFGIDVYSDTALYAGILLNVFCIDAAVAVGTLTAKKLYGNFGSVIFVLMSAVFVPYYIHAYRFYTDSLSIPYPILIILLYICASKASGYRKYVYYALMGLAVGIGVLIKASVVIAFVAVLLDIFTSKINKKTLCSVALCLGVTAVVFGSWNVIFQKSKWVDTQEYDSLNMPFTHWVMMALKGDGGYRQEDFEFSNSFPSRAEKKAAQIEEIKNRVRSYGSVDNFVEFEVNKIANVLADNRYIQNNHMEWCRNRGLLFEVVLETGKYFSKFSAYTKIFGTTMFMLWLFGIYKGINDKNKDKDFLLHVTIFGVILFFMLWETRSRYLLNYTPVFLLAAVGGISELKMMFDKNKKL